MQKADAYRNCTGAWDCCDVMGTGRSSRCALSCTVPIARHWLQEVEYATGANSTAATARRRRLAHVGRVRPAAPHR